MHKILLATAFLSVAASSTAHARPHPVSSPAPVSQPSITDWFVADQAEPSTSTKRRARKQAKRPSSQISWGAAAETPHAYHGGAGPRPSAWCGWYMRTRHGGGPEMNLAANWRHYGSAAAPQVGAIVVWPHHVGEIVGQSPNGQWIVLSGNDSGRVQQRARSIAGAAVRI